MSEQFPGQPPGQAQGHGPRSGVGGQSPIGLPGESIGTPRPPRQPRKRLGTALWIVFGLAFGCLVFWNATRPYFYVGYFVLAVAAWIRSMVRRSTRAQRRSRPPLRRD
jgi:hypothetical protein